MSQPYLLERIGGDDALKAAVSAFYGRVLADERLQKFFEGVDPKKLEAHQFRFLKLALTKVPKSVNVLELIQTKHSRLFDMGLNETHFDMVAAHLVEALKSLGVSEEHINEIVGIVGPLRAVFEKGAQEARDAGKA
mmetsp:Transcript_1345/g.3389  ORF Transcript_1345/g.3389 Transcript_1345/m.3389 type:complete len:136 (-) Transcript_1345:562-969(-)